MRFQVLYVMVDSAAVIELFGWVQVWAWKVRKENCERFSNRLVA